MGTELSWKEKSVQQVGVICDYLESLAPQRLSAEWDNVGLLVGDRQADVNRIMTCLTITADTVSEAIAQNADMIVVHHPLPFRPLTKLTTETAEGRYLLDLLAARIHVFSPHTAWDSAATGINQKLAEGIGLKNVAPLISDDVDANIGEGRMGTVSLSLAELANQVKSFLGTPHIRLVGRPDQHIERVAIGCGSGATFLRIAKDRGCEVLLTGEASFHHCLAAEADRIALLLAGHFSSERFAMHILAKDLTEQFAELEVWCSQNERDPIILL